MATSTVPVSAADAPVDVPPSSVAAAWLRADAHDTDATDRLFAALAPGYPAPVCGSRFNEARCLRKPHGGEVRHLSPDGPPEEATTAYEWSDDDAIGRTVDYRRPAEGRAA